MSCWKYANTFIFSLIFPPILLDDKAQVWRRNYTIAQVFVIFSLVLQFCYNHFTEKWRNLYKKKCNIRVELHFQIPELFHDRDPYQKEVPYYQDNVFLFREKKAQVRLSISSYPLTISPRATNKGIFHRIKIKPWNEYNFCK